MVRHFLDDDDWEIGKPEKSWFKKDAYVAWLKLNQIPRQVVEVFNPRKIFVNGVHHYTVWEQK